MMAQAIDWDDSSVATASGQPVATDEAWHVAVAPDDVKVVSLDQLDDMFRLSIVDSDTKVWQPGMSEWVPLGVIAGLDENPAPPTRTYPKPPSPRSAPPAPRPASLAPPSASFYAEPLRPVSYTAPLPPIPYMAPIASVRPLVVTHNPYPMPQSGGRFGRFIVGLALVAGVGITLYRNDVLRDAAHLVHQDGLYAQLEHKFGGPAFGTLRAVEQSANGEAAAALTLPNTSSDAEPTKAAGESAVLANVATMPTPKPAEAVRAGTGSPPVVSLESLGTEKGAAGGLKTEPKATPIAPVTRAVAPSFVSTPVAKAAPIAKAAPVAKAAPPEPKAVKAAPVEKPAPPPVASKPESEMTPRERLNAEIARSMLSSPASAKKSKPASTGLKGSGEYDPLNPKL
jgi:GYF domain 2